MRGHRTLHTTDIPARIIQLGTKDSGVLASTIHKT